MGSYEQSQAANAIMRRNIRRGNVFVYQVLFEGDCILLDIHYSGSSYRDSDLNAVINEAGPIARSYGVRMKWSLMEDY